MGHATQAPGLPIRTRPWILKNSPVLCRRSAAGITRTPTSPWWADAEAVRLLSRARTAIKP